MKSPNTNPKCPEHGKELDVIYPNNYKRLCRFRCGCIILKDEKMIEPNTLVGVCDCGLCFDAEYPPEFGAKVVAVCKKCHKIVIEEGCVIVKVKEND